MMPRWWPLALILLLVLAVPAIAFLLWLVRW